MPLGGWIEGKQLNEEHSLVGHHRNRLISYVGFYQQGTCLYLCIKVRNKLVYTRSVFYLEA